MSAIFGIINDEGLKVEYLHAQAMISALKHRAVDGSGVYLQDNILIGTHQLITAPSQKKELLPYCLDEFIVAADARIDNRLELIQLLGLNKMLDDIPDSVVILEAYRKWGNLCGNRLEGEFAFVIWNKKTRLLFAATDHIGFRSFYYYNTPNSIMFSSEIKGILAVKRPPHNFNLAVISEYIKANHSGGTFDTEIFTLDAASYLEYNIKASKPFIKKYWELKKQGKYRFTKDDEWADCLKELLSTAVKNRLNNLKPIGSLLSGGLDSSFITAIAASELQRQNKPIYTFSSALPHNYTGTEKDERYFINLLGEKYPNICQTFVAPPPEIGPFTNLDDIFERTEALCYPFIFMDQALYSAASDKNIGTLLSGFGGDFTISNNGNSMAFEMLKVLDLKNFVQYFNQLKVRNNLSFAKSCKAFITDYTLFFKIYEPVFNYLKKQENTPPLKNKLYKQVASKKNWGATGAMKKCITEIVNQGTMGGVMYSSLKKLSASYNLDCSVPIVDKNITEFFLDVPPQQFILGNKPRSLMRRAMEGIVPQEIQWRLDKGPFSPDFFRRFLSQDEYITNLLLQNHQKMGGYVDMEKIRVNLNSLKKMDASHETTKQCRLTAYAISVILFLNWLDEKKYII